MITIGKAMRYSGFSVVTNSFASFDILKVEKALRIEPPFTHSIRGCIHSQKDSVCNSQMEMSGKKYLVSEQIALVDAISTSFRWLRRDEFAS